MAETMVVGNDGKRYYFDKKEVAKCSQPIPVSFLQMMANTIFYTRDDQPLDFIDTLSSADTLLARAAAAENLARDHPRTQIHEIGPGNFNFARAFVDASLGLDDLAFVGHDFQDAVYDHVRADVEGYGGKILFDKCNISEFPGKSPENGMSVYLVEVLDDTMTDFFTMHEGREAMLFAVPAVMFDEPIPTRAAFARRMAKQGDFSKATQRRVGEIESMKEEYTPQELIALVQTLNIPELMKLHPGFLRNLEYNERQLGVASLDQIDQMTWRGMPEEFTPYRRQVVEFFREQLAQTSEGQFLHLPIAGVNFLYRMKDKRDVDIHFLDYGYEDPSYRVGSFTVVNGQITGAVNFGLMKYAAEVLGFETRLEKNREYIQRNTGFDTIPLGYVQRALKDDIPNDVLTEAFYESFHQHVNALSPNAICTPRNIMKFRIPRTAYEQFLAEGKAAGFIDSGFVEPEGSYHLHVWKD